MAAFEVYKKHMLPLWRKYYTQEHWGKVRLDQDLSGMLPILTELVEHTRSVLGYRLFMFEVYRNFLDPNALFVRGSPAENLLGTPMDKLLGVDEK